jgi:hypothetical protein
MGVAARLYGPSSDEQQAVRDGWSEVGIRVSLVGSARPAATAAKYRDQDSMTALHTKVDSLARAVEQLTRLSAPSV